MASIVMVGEVAGCRIDPVPEGVSVRPITRDDARTVGELYYQAYGGTADASVEAATADITASFEGEYGPFLWETSPVAERDGAVVAAVLTVERAPWDDVPDCPFIIEVFTDPTERRRGIARHLMTWTMAALARRGHDEVALRVMDDNSPALALYESLGFARR